MPSKYENLADRLTDLITANLKNGIYKLPTEADLCRQYHVSRQTVRQALTLLNSQGLITKRQGSGSYATGLSPDPSRNIIGMLISSDQEYTYPELISDIRSSLSAQGFTLKLYVTGNQIAKEREFLQDILSCPMRGLIAERCKSALPGLNLDLYERLHQQGIPILFLHSCPAAFPWAVCVKDDNFYGGYLLGQRLHTQGHTSIAGLFKSDDMQGLERYQGLMTYMRDMGHMIPDSQIGWFTSAELDSLQQKQDTHFLLEFTQKQLESCSAMVCYNDEIAYWVIKELQYAGYRIPQDMSVVCFDNSYLGELSRIRITTLTHSPHEMGTRTADCMIQLLQGIPVSTQELSWELLARESDSPPLSPS